MKFLSFAFLLVIVAFAMAAPAEESAPQLAVEAVEVQPAIEDEVQPAIEAESEPSVEAEPQLAIEVEPKPAEESAVQPTEGSVPKLSPEYIKEALKKFALLPSSVIDEIQKQYDDFYLFRWGKK